MKLNRGKQFQIAISHHRLRSSFEIYFRLISHFCCSLCQSRLFSSWWIIRENFINRSSPILWGISFCFSSEDKSSVIVDASLLQRPLQSRQCLTERTMDHYPAILAMSFGGQVCSPPDAQSYALLRTNERARLGELNLSAKRAPCNPRARGNGRRNGRKNGREWSVWAMRKKRDSKGDKQKGNHDRTIMIITVEIMTRMIMPPMSLGSHAATHAA